MRDKSLLVLASSLGVQAYVASFSRVSSFSRANSPVLIAHAGNPTVASLPVHCQLASLPTDSLLSSQTLYNSMLPIVSIVLMCLIGAALPIRPSQSFALCAALRADLDVCCPVCPALVYFDG